jgi:hypothetical protein
MVSRSRSGTTSSVATSFSALGASNPPSPLDSSPSSSKVNFRTKVLGKFERSSSSGNLGGLKLFKRSKSSTLPMPVVSTTQNVPTRPEPARQTSSKPVARAAQDLDGESGRHDYFSGPIPISVGARSLAHTSVSRGCITDPIRKMPVSPVSPPSDKPLPLTSVAAADTEALVIHRSAFFDDKLPRELKLQCFQALLALHKDEFERAHRKARGHGESRGAAIAFLQKRWVGEMAGRRELFRLTRVCTMYE